MSIMTDIVLRNSDLKLCLVAILFLLIYLYIKNSYKYWEKRGLYYIQPVFPFGNFKDAITKMSSGEAIKNLYDQAQGHDIFGFWIFHRPVLMPRSPLLIKHILVKDFPYFHDRAVHVDEKLDALSGHLFAMKGSKWKSLRAKLTPTFTSGKIKTMFHSVLDLSNEMVDFILPFAEEESVVELKDILARFTTDVISSCAFGISTNCIKNPEENFRKMGKKIFEPSFWWSLRVAILFMLPKVAETLKLRIIPKDVSEFFLSTVKQTIKERERQQIYRKDFMQLLIQLKNQTTSHNLENVDATMPKPRTGMSDEEVAAQAFVFFVAGFETSSTTMTFALYELAKNLEMQTKLQKEIDEILEKFGGLTYEAIQEMTYLDKVVSETLRMYPPITGLNRQCSKDYNVPGTDLIIEKGTLVMTSILGLHRDPNLYENPENFDPERFSEERKSKISPYTYLPFGEGPRVCIGMRFGMMQTKVGLTSLLAKYHFQLSEKSPIPMKLDPNSVVMTPHGGMWLKVTLR